MQVSALESSEASAPQRFKCISIMGDLNGGSITVRSRGGVLSREGPFLEVPLYLDMVIKESMRLHNSTKVNQRHKRSMAHSDCCVMLEF